MSPSNQRLHSTPEWERRFSNFTHAKLFENHNYGKRVNSGRERELIGLGTKWNLELCTRNDSKNYCRMLEKTNYPNKWIQRDLKGHNDDSILGIFSFHEIRLDYDNPLKFNSKFGYTEGLPIVHETSYAATKLN